MVGLAAVAGDAGGTHECYEVTLYKYLFAKVAGVVAQVAHFAECALCGQLNNKALRYFLAVGVGSDNEGRSQDCRSGPFNIIVVCHTLYFGRNGTYDIAFNPAVGSDTREDVLDCTGHVVGFFLSAGNFANGYYAVVIKHHDLPRVVVVAHDTHQVDVAYWQAAFAPCGVSARTYDAGIAFAVNKGAVLILVLLGVVYREVFLSAVGKVNVLESYDAALVFTQAFCIIGNIRECVYHKGVDFVELGHAVEQGFLFELLESHEAHLPGFAVGIPRLVAHLLQSSVFANGHTRYINDYFLAATVVEVEVVGVYREGEGCSFVLNYNAFKDVAFLVRRNHASLDDESVILVFGVVDAVGIVVGLVPKLVFEFEDSHVGLDTDNRLPTVPGHHTSSWQELNPKVSAAAAAMPVIYLLNFFISSVDYFLPLMARFLISQVSAPSALEPYLKPN